MPRMQPNSVIQSLRRAAFLSQSAELTDGELLEGYLRWRDEGPFEALLHRHGPMVLGVCRRVLQNEADAQDAFQATFLVFLRKAATIVPRAMVGNWLHGVAYKTALKAQAMNRQRRAKEREVKTIEPRVSAQDALQNRLELLDEALSRLPVKYRSAIVLCDLEGKTIQEAARQFQCPPGTVASRLASGRALLAKRLVRHGLCLTAATVARELAQGAVPSSLPKTLIASTVKAAATLATGQDVASVMSAKVVVLTERVVKAMLIAKLKTLTTALLAIGMVGAGGVLWTHSAAQAQPQVAQPAPAQASSLLHLSGEVLEALKDRGVALVTDEKPKSDKELIQGTWIPVSGEQNGTEIPKENLKGILTFTEDKFTMQLPSDGVREGTYTIDPEKKPKELDLTSNDNKTFTGIYELKGTRLKYVGMERGRPSDFSSTNATLVIYEKQNAKQEKAQASPSTAVAARDEKPKSDKELLQGTWITVSKEQNGAKLPKEKFEGGKMVFTEDKVSLQGQGEGHEGTYTIDPEKKPKEIDMTFGTATMMGLYELKGTTLKVVLTERGRPSDFDSAGATLVILEKKK